jgi:hypothetical protein
VSPGRQGAFIGRNKAAAKGDAWHAVAAAKAVEPVALFAFDRNLLRQEL